jgi:hypothetical protein
LGFLAQMGRMWSKTRQINKKEGKDTAFSNVCILKR